MRITRENVLMIEYLIMLVILVYALLILLSIVANSTTVNESIIITLNNSTDWRTNLSACCEWMG
jgi:hypothetical protein